MTWKYKGKNIKSLAQVPEGAYGFIYMIENIDAQKDEPRYYIGKKNLFFERKIMLGKREYEALGNRRLKKYKYVVSESDWLSYVGSNLKVKAAIEQGCRIKKKILCFCFSKRELTYREENFLHKLDVIENDNYYNDNIGGRFFRGNIT